MTFQKMVASVKKNLRCCKILIMGPDNSGKSSLLNSLLNLDATISPTFGYKIHNLDYKGTNLSILDIGGQTSFKAHWSNYFEKISGIIFIFDCSDDRDFSDYLNTIIGLDVPIAILANKIDLNENFSIEKRLKLEKDTSKNRIKIFKTSIFDKPSLEIPFDWIVNQSLVN